ncbi:histidine kinase [Flavobacterium sp. PL02]|uniref:sensor histidine kinase n=1 Tax=Flavobacterium sp. PL02 TaxID=3088354 RepID=UPI002B22B8BA|nr:histidine kinase [Flavobacterium sp. PL02]MEA9413982.1 histidine kinase [Flavobacterium sp. PL02]
MKFFKIYQNFFLRNSIINILVVGIILACVYDEFSIEVDWFYLFKKICLGYLPMYFGVLISNIFLIKMLFFEKKYKTFTVLFIIYWICFYFLMSWYFLYVDLGRLKTLSVFSLVCNGTGIYFLHLWIVDKISQTSKDIINYESELSFLKQQLNPHFLLNAMNNLYGEALVAPERLPDRILNLSDMLRYQIEATKKDFVLLVEEVEFIKKYVEYYTFRNERLSISQNYEGHFEGIEISPLFFLPLVENAVKFSGETAAPYIILDVIVKGRNLSFSIKNNFLVDGSRLLSTGIGIENLKRRLEVYGLKHELKCNKEDDLFSIKLNIWDLPTAAL